MLVTMVIATASGVPLPSELGTQLPTMSSFTSGPMRGLGFTSGGGILYGRRGFFHWVMAEFLGQQRFDEFDEGREDLIGGGPVAKSDAPEALCDFFAERFWETGKLIGWW